MKKVNSGSCSLADASQQGSLSDVLQGRSIIASRESVVSMRSLSATSLRKKNDVSQSVSDKDNVSRALKLMRRVDVPPIRTEHDYSTRKMFGEVTVIPLQKLEDIEKSAHISLHEKRIRENKLTPYQAELLATFDNAPGKIEEELVAQIVAEEEQAILLRKKLKKRAKAKKRQAWKAEAGEPETVSDVDRDELKNGKKGTLRIGNEDEGGSVCTNMTFSTANISTLHEDLVDIEVIDQFVEKPTIKLEKKPKKVLSRSRSQVARNRDKHLKEEEERKRAKILNKKTRNVVKKELTEVTIKQQIWLHLVAHFARVGKMDNLLQKYRAKTHHLEFIELQRRAMNRIMEWYKYYSMRRRMRQNASFLAKIRMRLCIFMRRRRVRKLNEAATLVSHFIACVNGASVRTQKLYKFRGRVVKIQNVFGQFYKCQRARLKLLYLALQRELHSARLERNFAKRLREKNSVRLMKRTHFFGEAVQKLDNICASLTEMIARKNATNNLKMKQFLQLQNEDDKKHSKVKTHATAYVGDNQHSQSQYEVILKRVLGNQRKRHILSKKGADHTQKKVISTSHAIVVDPMEVKAFLKTDGHAGPKYLALDPVDIKKRRHSPLILLTGGAIRELRDIAKGIVAEESEEKVNFEIQRVLLKEYNDEHEYQL
mmetsp:Transcript_17922/g.29979  ORF Transcript_17922/g.29979 Transcript_17922/m.29979 type:complete len:655 (+) Transcript_17922:217-2181(+)